MDYKTILYEAEDGVAVITINRPEALNSLTPEVLSEMAEAVEAAAGDPATGVIVITGAGRAFCSGVDLKAAASLGEADIEARLHGPARRLQSVMETAPVVVIGMVNGFCLTGGLEIVLACDLLVASENAKFADTHTKWGLRCMWGMSVRLPQRVGEMKAREMTYTGEMISGREAERIGLVNKAAPAAELKNAVWDLAGKIMANSKEANAAHKLLYYRNKMDSMKESLEREYSADPKAGDAHDRIQGFAKS
ncbi:Enoyl-CoA hydratase/isomerase [Desulfatibacillum aliphaticivorans]|uniref:Enoyl-CoA hydratase/isomerase n=1 Tax=Desulfatibacillum aliphaticivorans TaxID=218208 RepID=B8F9Q0_DESAL|nr:enoyl-CoA hydratase/isomerase family protein [Desulfatibacillum aliphaticivorans]ACL02996.1 Enoyl-CoA hydratase/isomerase [Desulfatibacillum aliphaticivorans]